MKIAAAAQGADIDFDDDWYQPEESYKKDISEEVNYLPFGLGYEDL